MSGEMFKSSERLDGGQSGVFEYDGETGYFYLYDISKEDGKQIIGHLHVVSGSIEFSENDVKIVWDAPREVVGLFINECLWAAFHLSGKKFGGNYSREKQSLIPIEVKSRFLDIV